MKSEWKEVELSEVADLTVGFVGTMASHYTDSGVLFLRSTNIEPFNIKMDDVKYISPEFNETIKKSQLNPDDVVIVRTGKPGACTVIPQKTEPWNCSDLVIIHPNKEKINPHFLASYINLASGVINAHLVGAVQQHFNVGAAKKMKIPLPSIDVQNRIASIIQGLNDKIELNNKINENLERQAQAIFKSWFLDYLPFYSIKPTSWKFSTLGEATKMSAGGDKPKSISSIKSTEYPYPIYSNGLDNEGLYGYTNEAKIFDESVTVSARGTIGFVCLRHIPYVPIVRLVTLIPDENMISAKYLYLYLKQLHISGTGTTQQQLTVPDFCKTEILIPDKTTMDKFTNLISPMFNRIWTNKEENIKLASLRDNLLPKLMSGEINVSDIQLYYFNSCL